MPGERKSKGGRAPAAGGRGAPSQEQIARRAHEIFLARGGEPGHELEDWLQAEKELREEAGKASRPRAKGASKGAAP